MSRCCPISPLHPSRLLLFLSPSSPSRRFLAGPPGACIPAALILIVLSLLIYPLKVPAVPPPPHRVPSQLPTHPTVLSRSQRAVTPVHALVLAHRHLSAQSQTTCTEDRPALPYQLTPIKRLHRRPCDATVPYRQTNPTSCLFRNAKAGKARQGKASKPQALGTTLCKKNVRALFVVRPAIRSVVESVILDIPEALTAKVGTLRSHPPFPLLCSPTMDNA